MLSFYSADHKKIKKEDLADALHDGVLWVDMLQPDAAEEKLVEDALVLDVPTKEDMKAIELSNRLYKDEGALFMTATLVVGTDTPAPLLSPVSFILTNHKLITVRDHEPKAFQLFSTRAQRSLPRCSNGEDVLIGLLETIVDRLSDPLENVANEIERISHEIFRNGTGKKKTDFNEVLRIIGQKGDLNSKVKETLLSLDRVISFLTYNIDKNTLNTEMKHGLASLEQDVRALTDHASFLSNKINFVLEATLGMINIEQNTIIKFFSVAAVIFLPPTLIASTYGMNFHFMPELDWPFGYPIALIAMLMSAILPYLYFRHRRWL
ncbi:magnesium/cobalt transporter CorA [Micavibrio aeruginosavorus]|uniref:magnesium/cobalt transporter CorA n=1 Tax=Micavibrio aeruginosavorus TaxID=349221 RepID=UPI003F4AE016